jgi:ubiquinone/menaquinone biosynthesis C-methylase UbiE
LGRNKDKTELFDQWPDAYDRWFTTAIGQLVKRYEAELILDLLKPGNGDLILDAGCGTGVFTLDILSFGPDVIGLDVSLPMLRHAREKTKGLPFRPVLGDMSRLPFHEDSFDRTVSVTALEFIRDAKGAIRELFRVTKKGGLIVVATLNSLSPWAARRRVQAKKGHVLFQEAIFRSPEQLRSLSPVEGVIRTAIHFPKDADPHEAAEIETGGSRQGLTTGAFVVVAWKKP